MEEQKQVLLYAHFMLWIVEDFCGLLWPDMKELETITSPQFLIQDIIFSAVEDNIPIV